MRDDQIIEDLLAREGPGVPPYLVPGDQGGRTAWGVSERAHPLLWVNGPPTRAQARVLYVTQYVAPFDIFAQEGLDDRIRVAVIDDAVLSGVPAAVKRLQHVLGVPMDGVIGPMTLTALHQWYPGQLIQAYVKERAIRITRLVQRMPAEDLPFLTGWITRILDFLPEPA